MTNRKDRRTKKAVTRKVAKNVPEITLHVISNDIVAEVQIARLQMFYKGAFANTIGIADVKDARTGEEYSVLTGLSPAEDGSLTIVPIARIFDNVEDIRACLAPDFQGGWGAPLVGEKFEQDVANSAAQQAMSKLAEALS